MGRIRDLANKLSAIKESDVEEKILDIIEAEKEQVIDLNRSQLLHSEDSEGEWLGEYASIAYANKKGKANVDLKLTGALHESIYAKTDKFPILFGASDPKAPDLMDKYGKDIFGLNKQSIEVVSKEIVKTGLIGWFKDLFHV